MHGRSAAKVLAQFDHALIPLLGLRTSIGKYNGRIALRHLLNYFLKHGEACMTGPRQIFQTLGQKAVGHHLLVLRTANQG